MSNADHLSRTMSALAGVCRQEQTPKRYRIGNIHEEGVCHYCGYPLLIQDEAYEYRELTYCSQHCAFSD